PIADIRQCRDRRFLKVIASPTPNPLSRVSLCNRVAWSRAWARANMRRREFIKLIASCAAACPVGARAQQQPPVPVIGFLYNGSPGAFQQLEFFRRGLREGGYFEGQNLAIEYRWAQDQPDRLPELAVNLVRRHVAVIASVGGTNAALA